VIHQNKALLDKIKQLEQENKELRQQNASLAAVLADGPRTPNTDMVMGAMLSGGDVMKLAKDLAHREESTRRKAKP